MRRTHRLVGLVSAAVLVGAAIPASAAATGGEARQQRYADAAADYGVPREILLAVSYLESRWNTNGGNPSTSAGFGPMHLTDLAGAGVSQHHSDGTEDPRGDESRPFTPPELSKLPVSEPSLRTVERAAELTGISTDQLRTDAGANIAGGAAVLADYQRKLGLPLSTDPAKWYAAVARYSGASDEPTARAFAEEVFAVLATGATRTTDDGHHVSLAPTQVTPDRGTLRKLALRAPSAAADEAECPAELACEWLPAPYQDLGGGDYGNHDLGNRPADQQIEFIVIHDTEGSYQGSVNAALDPTYLAWHYTMRTQDGHIAQHVKAKDVGWHAGNWYVNAKSIGIEHEGWAARGTWYTEVMYRASAKLVRYLADKYDIPLNKQHILGHDNVQGPTSANVPGMHWDPGPYWDWTHYFELMGAPFEQTSNDRGGLVTIDPDFQTNRPAFTGCEANPGPPGEGPRPSCGAWGSSALILHTEPRNDAPLLKDIGRNPGDGQSTMRVSDHGSRVSAGQQYAVAGRRGDWTAIWYLGQKGWFLNPRRNPTALWASGLVVTPKPGRTSIPVYGRAYPEASAYPAGVPVQSVVPIMYSMPAGQRYPIGLTLNPEYYYAVQFDASKHKVVRGVDTYYQIQFGHRVAYVKASDVQVRPSGPRR